MGFLGEVAQGTLGFIVKAGGIVLKEGYKFGKATGKGTIKGTGILVKEIGKKITKMD